MKRTSYIYSFFGLNKPVGPVYTSKKAINAAYSVIRPITQVYHYRRRESLVMLEIYAR